MLVEHGFEGGSSGGLHLPLDLVPKTSSTLERRREWEHRFRVRLLLSDTTVMLVSVGTAAVAQAATTGVWPGPWWPIAALVVVWWLFLTGLRSRGVECSGRGTQEYRRVVNATGLSFGLIALIMLLGDLPGHRVFLLTALTSGTGTLLLTRWGWRRWLQRKRLAGEYGFRTLVVGDRDDVGYVIRGLNTGGESGYHVVGTTLFDHDRSGAGECVANSTDAGEYPATSTGAAPDGPRFTIGETAYPVLGTVDTVAETAHRLGADTIIIASRPAGRSAFVRELSWKLEGTAAELVLSNRVTDVVGPRLSLRPLDGLPLVHIRIPAYEGGHHLLKRGLDLTVSALALAAIALVFPVIAALIALDSRGPIFFKQERIGRDGRAFTMFKFRTMVVAAEDRLPELLAHNEGAGPLFKLRNDPRVTRVGRVLRAFSLDELPQFWNVLRGDMSVVGPRPPLPTEVLGYDGSVVRRLYVKPGITGPWQVGGRSNLSWQESVRLDLSYVENWSVMNDLQIMWRTVRVMANRQGAY